MVGEFITRILLMILGYAYPALQCYKTIERRNRVDNAELRFWCEYWIIIAILTVLERFGDLCISWLPMYTEAKLAFVIYLWYPKTKGTSYVYETLLRPFVSEHETDIDQKLHNLRGRVWDLAIFYWQNCTEVGQSKFFEVLEHLFSQSSKANNKQNVVVEVPSANFKQTVFVVVPAFFVVYILVNCALQVEGDPSTQRPKPSAPPLPPPNTFSTFFSRAYRRHSTAKTWDSPRYESITVY
ncbi:unnamed protein product [Rhodiola kirilowii]